MKAVARVTAMVMIAMAGVVSAAQAPKMADMKKLDIMLMKPAAAKTGDNQFEVMVKDEKGMPVTKADVSLQFVMPAMPAMKNETKLAPAGGGLYRGPGQVMMAGQWQATVTVMRGGQRLGSKQLPIVAH